MLLRRGQLPILIATALYLAIALFLFLNRANYEFVMYVAVIVIVFVLIMSTNKKVFYPNFVLWGLSFWGLLHMAGGAIIFNNGASRLYDIILIPISNTYQIFRYDQFVHIIGFGVSTLLMFTLLKPLLKSKWKKWASLSIVVVMAGMGVGALNEIIEFTATVVAPQTGVGGYINTSMDLVSNMVGAIIAMIIIRVRKGNL